MRIIRWFKNIFQRKQNLHPVTEVEKPEIPENNETPWLDIAKLEIGQHEVSGSQSNKRIIEYGSATTGKPSNDEIAWCSSFVTWILEQSGFKSTKSTWARSYLKYGISLNEPKIGCIVVFDRGNGYGHVGFCAGFTSTDLKILGGNQSNSVCFKWYSKDKVLGYRWPVK